jgi:hypothetical protein
VYLVVLGVDTSFGEGKLIDHWQFGMGDSWGREAFLGSTNSGWLYVHRRKKPLRNIIEQGKQDDISSWHVCSVANFTSDGAQSFNLQSVSSNKMKKSTTMPTN